MKTIDFSYFIERYIVGEMNDAEIVWFRKELEGNEKLRDEVSLRQKTEKVLKDQDIIQLRSKLYNIEKLRASNTPVKNPGKNSAFKYAALIAGFIIIGGITFLSLSTRNLTNEEIINKYHKPYEGISASRSFQSEANLNYTTALEYYNIHDYRNAALFFSKVLDSDPDNMESTMLLGTSNFEEKNFPLAEQSFKKVLKNNNNFFIEDARWYLALCYVQTEEKQKALDQLTLIKNSESIYSDDARKILRKIK